MSFIHPVTNRPWGSYEVLLDTPSYKVKRIIVKAGQRLSLQRHKHRRELWACVHGGGTTIIGPSLNNLGTLGFSPESFVVIPPGTIHRVVADPNQDLVFIEVQTGTYFGEDDIERFEDDYGRAD